MSEKIISNNFVINNRQPTEKNKRTMVNNGNAYNKPPWKNRKYNLRFLFKKAYSILGKHL